MMTEIKAQIVQDDQIVPLRLQEGTYYARLKGAPFEFVFPEGSPEVFGVTFGFEGLFESVTGPEEMRPFGLGAGYARYEEPDAPYYFTDPLCASSFYGPGFNYLLAPHRIGNRYPVAEVHPDAASRRCENADKSSADEDILPSVSRLFVLLRVEDDQFLRVVLDFARS